MKQLKCFQHLKWDIVFKKLIPVWYLTSSFHFLLSNVFFNFHFTLYFPRWRSQWHFISNFSFFLNFKVILKCSYSWSFQVHPEGRQYPARLVSTVRPAWVRIPSPLPHNCFLAMKRGHEICPPQRNVCYLKFSWWFSLSSSKWCFSNSTPFLK